MSAKHRPFPRLVVDTYTTNPMFTAIKQHAAIAFDNDSRGLVAVTGPVDEEHSQKYAKLFAAAPDLLEALKAIVAWQDDPNKDSHSWERRLFEARAAIAKATVEGK